MGGLASVQTGGGGLDVSHASLPQPLCHRHSLDSQRTQQF
jgi:hypothetical protein